jgi:hypothetical protein
MASSQTHPIQKYRNHLSDHTLALVEVLGRDADRDLIRSSGGSATALPGSQAAALIRS